jgi:hypothetical protein
VLLPALSKEKKTICGKACPQNKIYSKAVAFTVLTE